MNVWAPSFARRLLLAVAGCGGSESSSAGGTRTTGSRMGKRKAVATGEVEAE
jgi:hypothetical protein